MCERERVCVCMCERESVCVCVCVCERERECVRVCYGECVREVCVYMSLYIPVCVKDSSPISPCGFSDSSFSEHPQPQTIVIGTAAHTGDTG